MKAKDLDKQFDAGNDISKHLDLARALRTNEKPRRVNVDFPAWMIQSLDKAELAFKMIRKRIDAYATRHPLP